MMRYSFRQSRFKDTCTLALSACTIYSDICFANRQNLHRRNQAFLGGGLDYIRLIQSVRRERLSVETVLQWTPEPSDGLFSNLFAVLIEFRCHLLWRRRAQGSAWNFHHGQQVCTHPGEILLACWRELGEFKFTMRPLFISLAVYLGM